MIAPEPIADAALACCRDVPFGARWWQRQARSLAQCGLLNLRGRSVFRAVDADAQAWRDFAAHWDRLALDRYMADGGRYRLRRYGAMICGEAPGEEHRWRLLPHGAYQQPRSVNWLNGGIDRFFEPLESSFVQHPLLHRVIGLAIGLIQHGQPRRGAWKVDLHPYRIVARPDCPGQPTPEGLHRDGVDYTAALLVRRANIDGGDTHVADADRRELQRLRLSSPLDLLLLDDARTLHEVSAIVPRRPHAQAWRDVLVIAFTRCGD